MQKLVILACALVVSAAASAEVLTIQNTTHKTVVLGSYRGIVLPSICEHTGYSFCLEEAFVKFKPLGSKYKNIKGEVSVDMADQDHALWMEVDGSQTEINGNCSNYSESTLGYLQRLSGEVRFSDIQNVSVCFETETVKIIID